MTSPPVMDMQPGAPAPQSSVGADQKHVTPTSQSPSGANPSSVLQAAQMTQEDVQKFIDIAKAYRDGWNTDRLLRIAQWMKNVMFDRGQQVLAWDPDSKTYFDALAWYRQNGDTAEADEVERFVNNITQMMKMAFVGTLSRSVPPTVIRPQNAEILADVTTAKAAQQAITIIERMNQMPALVRMQAAYLFLYGVYFKQTRFVIDGEWAGYDEEEQLGDITISKPHRLRCDNCGGETPVSQLSGQDGQDQPCPNCQSPIGPGNFYPAEDEPGIGVVGTTKEPRGMVKWSIFSPLEIEVNPKAKDLNGTALLAKETDIDYAEALATYPNFVDSIKEGVYSTTSPSASYERLRRAESKLVAAPQDESDVTLSEIWFTTRSFWKKGDKEFARRMKQKFPMGMKLTLIGETAVDIREKALVKEWSVGRLSDEHGLLPPATADVVVPFNERFNDTMDKIDDYYARVANGLTLVNGTALDEKKMGGMTLEAGQIVPIYLKGEGSRLPMSEVVHQVSMSIDKSILEYPNMLINFAQMLSGCVPQVFGDTVDGVDTLGGQKQALSQAQVRFAIYWNNMKDEQAHSAQNAIECYQNNMSEDMFEVEEENGSEFRNGYVRWNEMQGRVRVWPDPDAGLPQSPEDIRTTVQQLVEQVAAGNPVAIAWFDVVSNQEIAASTLMPSGSVQPGAAQRSVTLQDIHKLVEFATNNQQPPATLNAQTGQPNPPQLPVQPKQKYTDFKVARATMLLYMQENDDLSLKNPYAWQLLDTYYDLLISMDVNQQQQEGARKLSIAQAGMPTPPQPPPPDPTIVDAKHELISKAKEMVDRLDDIAKMPPQGQNGNLAPQVTAANSILTAATKAATA